MPLYLQQDLGIHGLGRIAIWAGIVGFGPAIPASIFGPMWGKLADKHGYRVMLLRAMASAAVLLALMGFAQSVWVLVVLRMVQGSLTGTIYSAQALVASNAPEQDTGRAMGLLQMSVYGGATVGPVAGGIIAALLGYRAAFFGAGALLLVATLIVFAFVSEPKRIPRPERVERESKTRASLLGMMSSAPFAAALAFTVVCQVASSSQLPILPLFVQQLLGGTRNVVTATGWLLAISGLSAAAGSYIAGRMHRKFGLTQPLQLMAGLCAVLLLIQAFSPSYVSFLLLRSASAFFIGGLFALIGVWAAGASPRHAKGAAFGLVGAASSLGFGAGPLLGGLLVSVAGLRAVFIMAAVLVFGAFVSTLFRRGKLVDAPVASSDIPVAGEVLAAE